MSKPDRDRTEGERGVRAWIDGGEAALTVGHTYDLCIQFPTPEAGDDGEGGGRTGIALDWIASSRDVELGAADEAVSVDAQALESGPVWIVRLAEPVEARGEELRCHLRITPRTSHDPTIGVVVFARAFIRAASSTRFLPGEIYRRFTVQLPTTS